MKYIFDIFILSIYFIRFFFSLDRNFLFEGRKKRGPFTTPLNIQHFILFRIEHSLIKVTKKIPRNGFRNKKEKNKKRISPRFSNSGCCHKRR